MSLLKKIHQLSTICLVHNKSACSLSQFSSVSACSKLGCVDLQGDAWPRQHSYIARQTSIRSMDRINFLVGVYAIERFV